MSYGGLEKLVGATILATTRGEDTLMFMTDRGFYTAEPYGDCCANCYVQHVSGTDALAPGAVVAAVEDIELPPVPEGEQNDVSDVWGHKIRTDKGWCTIEMRVDHNGYYGGSLNLELTSEGWPDRVHDDCKAHPELALACGCFGRVLDDF